jgi:hypothetical protein
MAACVVEDTRLRLIYYQTKPKLSQGNIYVNSNQMDSTKKRQLSRSNTFHSNNELTKTEIDNSCSIQAVSTDNNNESMKYS